MIAAKAVTFTRVVTSLTAAPTRAPSTLANVRMMMAAIAIICTVAVPADRPSRLSRNSAKTTDSAATVVGVVTSTYSQPNTNAAASPYASRRNTYTPPARGSRVLSSATASAPQMLISPNAVQSPMMTSGFGTSPAMVGGVRKIPLPIVMPTISAVPPASPMTRRRSCDCVVKRSADRRGSVARAAGAWVSTCRCPDRARTRQDWRRAATARSDPG